MVLAVWGQGFRAWSLGSRVWRLGGKLGLEVCSALWPSSAALKRYPLRSHKGYGASQTGGGGSFESHHNREWGLWFIGVCLGMTVPSLLKDDRIFAQAREEVSSRDKPQSYVLWCLAASKGMGEGRHFPDRAFLPVLRLSSSSRSILQGQRDDVHERSLANLGIHTQIGV